MFHSYHGKYQLKISHVLWKQDCSKRSPWGHFKAGSPCGASFYLKHDVFCTEQNQHSIVTDSHSFTLAKMHFIATHIWHIIIIFWHNFVFHVPRQLRMPNLNSVCWRLKCCHLLRTWLKAILYYNKKIIFMHLWIQLYPFLPLQKKNNKNKKQVTADYVLHS